jgi:glutathione peroxidase
MSSVYDQIVTDIDGKSVPLSTYKGKVLLVVNVASRCGYTPQYTDLEKLWEKYRGSDFALLGFPSNDFGRQEPGTEHEIKEFCSLRYQVDFPMFSKVVVKGAGKSPLYAILSEAKGEPKWNFHKYLVGKDGQVLQAFKSSVEPLSSELTSAIDAALAA